ncbi:response regulator transcription factor [Paraflavisolibacter sp. H34]|uniref:response regulator transcription factor n=1 Tax=Huijunlia imazamoxiresistens TaxID=3127457 RepID=UPI0030170EA6
MTQILLLEDDIKMASEIKLFLDNQGYPCDVVNDGSQFFVQADTAPYQIYLLDINVPRVSGMEVCKRIRANNSATPILMLTAYGAVAKKVQALEYGADDYLVKPFHLDELLARIKALLRRSSHAQKGPSGVFSIADLVLDPSEMKVKRAGKEINLTLKEYKLLELLAQARGKILSKQTIAEQVWDIHFETGTNTIEVYISFLRNKIDKGFDLPLIHTKPGYGYYLKESK